MEPTDGPAIADLILAADRLAEAVSWAGGLNYIMQRMEPGSTELVHLNQIQIAAAEYRRIREGR